MASVLSPPTHLGSGSTNLSLTNSAKRKREDINEPNDNVTTSSGANAVSIGLMSAETHSMIDDLLELLKAHDPMSILTRPVPSTSFTTSSSEPQAKRHKAGGELTILGRGTSNAYATVKEVLEDLDAVISDLSESLGSMPQLTNATDRKQISSRALAFKKRAHSLVERELASRQHSANLNKLNLNGNHDDNTASISTPVQLNSGSIDKNVVLTLYGNAQTAKQLFSSLQLSTKVTEEAQDVVRTLNEAGLPPGITTTQVVPMQSSIVTNGKKSVKSLGELFPTPLGVRSFEPPRPSKTSTTRETKVGWYYPATVDSPSRTASYFEQKITTGLWVDYSNASPVQNVRRKQRDRALSLGGAKVSQSDSEPTEFEAAKTDSLFRSAYSTFAPTIDNSAAVITAGTVAKLWWQQVGENKYDRSLGKSNILENYAGHESLEEEKDDHSEDQDEVFRKAVEWHESQSWDSSTEVEKSAEEKDADEVLKDISELLETLNSYQRIRNMSLNPPSRPNGLSSATDAVFAGTPAKPSDSEIATYEVLKSQLTLMIASLPPFAVAKLDPNQLSELSISTKIPIHIDNYNGVMEEDDLAIKVKPTAPSSSISRTPQTGPAPRAVHNSTYNTQYVPRTTAPTPQYYNSSQNSLRANSMQRPSGTPASAPYPLQRPSSGSTPYRPQSYGTPTYAHQAVRPVAPQYIPPSTTGAYPQAPTQGYARPVGQSYQNPQHNTPQASNRYPGQPSYSQQTPATHAEYRYSNGSTDNQASPQMYHTAQARNNYRSNLDASAPSSNSTTPMMGNQRLFQPNRPAQTPMMNGGSSQSPQPQAPHQQAHSSGANTYSTFLSAEQQSSLLERQRATLAAQQTGTQQQVRQAAQPMQQTNGVGL